MTHSPAPARVQPGVPTGGQFATSARDESDVTLNAPATSPEPTLVCSECGHRTTRNAGAVVHVTATDTKRQHVAQGSPLCAGASEREIPDYIDALARGYESDHVTYALVPHAEREVADAVEHAARAGYPAVPPEFMAQIITAQHAMIGDNGGGPLGYARGTGGVGVIAGEAYLAGMPADWPEQMAERGQSWTRDCVSRWSEGLTDEHLADLDRRDLARSPAMAHAFIGCDLDTAKTWVDAAGQDPDFSRYLKRYLDLPGIGACVRDGISLEDVKLAHSLGLEPGVARTGLTRPDGAVERGPAAIREIAQYKTACAMSEDEARAGIRAGVEAKTVKAFGPKIDPSEIGALQSAGVPAKVARSLRGRAAGLPIPTIAKLNDSGITSGAEYKAWMTLTETTTGGIGHPRVTTSDLDVACDLSKAGVPLAAAQHLRTQSIPLGAIGEVHAAGISDWSSWREGVHQRTQVSDRDLDATTAIKRIAAFTSAGGSPAQFGRAQKAGIPLADLPAHITSSPADLWAAGAVNRAAVLAEERRVHSQWGSSFAAEPKAWPVSGPEDL